MAKSKKTKAVLKRAPKSVSSKKMSTKPKAKKVAASKSEKSKSKVKVKSKASVLRRAIAKKKSSPVSQKSIKATADRVLKTAEVEGLMMRLPPPVQPIMNSLRRIVSEAAPNAVEFLERNAAAYDSNGVFARIEPHESRVLIKFMKGAQLPSAKNLTKSEGEARTMELNDVAKIQHDVLKKLVREAVLHNLKSRQ
jgi:hypothetical protein